MDNIHIEASLSDYIDNPISEEAAEKCRQAILLRTKKIAKVLMCITLIGFVGYVLLLASTTIWIRDTFSSVVDVMVIGGLAAVIPLIALWVFGGELLKSHSIALSSNGEYAFKGVSLEDFDQAEINEAVLIHLDDPRRLLDNIKKLGRKPYAFEANLIMWMLVDNAQQIFQDPGAQQT